MTKYLVRATLCMLIGAAAYVAVWMIFGMHFQALACCGAGVLVLVLAHLTALLTRIHTEIRRGS